MKLASIDTGLFRTLAMRDDDGSLIDLKSLRSVPTNLADLLAQGQETLRDVSRAARSTAERLDPAEVRFLPPVPNPGAVWCAMINYEAHAREAGGEPTEYPPFFLRLPSSLSGHREPIVKPTVSEWLDYEGELAVVIGRRGRHVPEAHAMEMVAGYSCFDDGSVRDWQRHTTQMTSGKNFAKTGGFGPWLTTADEVPDIEDARLTTRVNGEVRQSAKVGDMVHSISRLVSYISTVTELVPGDVIVTGTPGGVGVRRTPPAFLAAGDVVEVEIEGVGLLENPITNEEGQS